MSSTKFQVGESYGARSICDHDCIFVIRVVSRTHKTIQVIQYGKQKMLRVAIGRDGVEQVKPFGTYSMCAVIEADERAVELAAGKARAAANLMEESA